MTVCTRFFRKRIVNIWLFCNFLFKTAFLARNVTNALLYHMVTLKVHAFVATCYHGMHAFSTELCALRTEPSCKSFWYFPCHLWLPRCFFWASKRWNSLGAKTPHSPTDGSPVAAIWMEVSRTSTVQCTVHPWLDTTWLTSFRSSGETKSNTPHLRIHNSPPPILILIHMHSDNITIFATHFNIIVPPTSGVARFVTPKNSNHNGNPWQK